MNIRTRSEKTETCVEKTASRVTMETEVRVLSYTPRYAKDCHQTPEWTKGRKDRPLEPSEGALFDQHLDLGLLVPRTARLHSCYKPLSVWYFVTTALHLKDISK